MSNIATHLKVSNMTNEEMYAEEIVLPKGFFLQIIFSMDMLSKM